MIKRIFIIILFLMFAGTSVVSARKVSVSAGINGSFMPSMGGNLNSYTQENEFGSASGIDGINRSMDGHSTSDIQRLNGAFLGLDLKAVFYDYFIGRIGFNYGMSLTGGHGKTVYSPDSGANYYDLKCEYSYKEYDIPVTAGLSIPFWQDSRISISCGTAFAKATYENKFESDTAPAPFEYKGRFSGWAFPLVVIIQGDYFIRQDTALTSAVFYYRGRSRILRDGSDNDGNIDFASLDFTGYRVSLGVSYYFQIE